MKQRFNHVQFKLGLWSRLLFLIGAESWRFWQWHPIRGGTLNVLMRHDNKRWVVQGVTFGEGEPVDGQG